MNILNLPDWKILDVEDSRLDYRVHATYVPGPTHCQHCGLFAKIYKQGTRINADGFAEHSTTAANCQLFAVAGCR